MSSTPNGIVTTAVAAFILFGCGQEPGSESDAVIVDSAGIRIVTNTSPTWTDATAWRLSGTPQLVIGSVEGDPSTQLFHVVGGVILEDGRIAIANAGTHELRYFGADGRHLHTTGREGAGPGEFRSIGWLQRFSEDSLAVWDWNKRELSIFDATGRFARSFRLEGVGGTAPSPLGVWGDGRILAEYRPRGPVTYGRSRPTETLVVYAPDGTGGDSIGTYHAREEYVRRMHVWGRDMNMWLPVPFGRSAALVVSHDHLYLGAREGYEIGVYTPQGALQSIVRLDRLPRPITDDDLQAELGRLTSFADDEDARRVLAELREAEIPETMPAFGKHGADSNRNSRSLRVDTGGNLWVLEYAAPDDSATQWSVFDPTGVYLGTMPFPDQVVPLDIGDDYVLAHWRDELDVEYVGRYQLIKP
ncbi:MAG: hypothetical protein GTN62_10590 [Gemmatimonadales bacterium]|nr:hypothetical protein [Gemmatimonadales bacterium]NIN12011.1 hypothetical protein [Gemmatimonadales bacterium]NIN50542.1 hypothetical protein [Gemmatimonadales bacterium]NIP08006.1 hypothetical protein [Gemmatimonadales bacterium]NIR00608.1 hypothetical protein [Gemmatimonadales bacterium]